MHRSLPVELGLAGTSLFTGLTYSDIDGTSLFVVMQLELILAAALPMATILPTVTVSVRSLFRQYAVPITVAVLT